MTEETAPAPRRVIGYGRQAPSERGIPELELEQQERQIRNACAAHGWEFVEMLSDLGVVDEPAADPPPAALRRAVHQVGTGKAEALVVCRADRVSCMSGPFEFLDRLRRNGGAFVALEEEWDTDTEHGGHAADVLWSLARVHFWREVPRTKPGWDGRNAVVARYVPPGTSVLDLGAGAMTLRDHIPGDCTYQACDIVDTGGGDVLVCDFNLGIWPAVSERYDVVVASGVIEYLTDPSGFVLRAARMGDALILTHVLRGVAAPGPTMGWNTHLTEGQMTELLDALPVTWALVDRWERHAVYEIRATA